MTTTSTDSLCVAVTGPTGTFGSGLLPLLEREPRVGSVVGVARRAFDPADRGWSKMRYRQGDVRDYDGLLEAFRDVDVVTHLAFLITGGSSAEDTRAINVEGTLNAYRAAAAAGARRFVYASSVAAYGFHPDNPVPMSEDWPVRPAGRLFYAQEKAELEQRLQEEAAKHPDLDLYLLRPSIVLGPDAVGGKDLLPDTLAPVVERVLRWTGRLPVRVPVAVPDFPMQFVHQSDVGQALMLCILGSGPPGAYNIAGDGVVTVADVVRELGARPVRLPTGPLRYGARALAALPLPLRAQWVEAAARPAIMDTTRARRELGWDPEFDGISALRDTLHPALNRH
jgi:nucleoside-diphosphate-sugar epimerase